MMPFKSYMKGRIFQHFIIIGLLCVPHIAIPNRLKFCVGPDRCSCMEGYKGKDCNKDVNECGLPIRPCSHRCMNTMGSYRCFCNHGYMLDTDGKSCVKHILLKGSAKLFIFRGNAAPASKVHLAAEKQLEQDVPGKGGCEILSEVTKHATYQSGW
ncbi:nephronectin-like isoform X2 [Labeo rohita]|uniref:Nephronectin-like isoform X2 n=1 Tax=Labeo rohita TaxID=84645 RepID=A0A498N735_LABRO|nr:nephronectin-like isoform X2 [Labeo rohita]